MRHEDAVRLEEMIGEGGVFRYEDADGDRCAVVVNNIAAFAYSEDSEDEPIGF